MKITIEKGDITLCEVDAIVNAAKKTLLGGGGVDGAIHKAAGVGLVEECRCLPVVEHPPIVDGIRCNTGDAKITKGYDLPAAYVIHTVGPDCREGSDVQSIRNRRRTLLAECWMSCLKKAHLHKLKSIAFPSISTGIFGFPIGEAARIAIACIRMFSCLRPESTLKEVSIVCFSEEDEAVYRRALDK